MYHVSCCVLSRHHLSPVVSPTGLFQLWGVHCSCCTAAPVNSLLQGKEINKDVSFLCSGEYARILYLFIYVDFILSIYLFIYLSGLLEQHISIGPEVIIREKIIYFNR